MDIKKATSAFHWRSIALPIAILFLSLVLSVVFYPRLPAELAYHFQDDGSPDRWLSRNQIILAMLLPQFLLTLLAGATTWGVTKLSARFRLSPQAAIKPGRPVPVSGTGQALSKVEGIIWLMGNMVVLPQIVLSFAMLDIFSYNAYGIHIMPLWLFAVIVMGTGGIVLGIFFFRAVRKAWRATQ